MKKIPMTPGGLERLRRELDHLKNTERHEIIKAIASAREHGDLSENAEYHAARERQSFVEGRVAELEDVISRAEVIDVSKLSGETVTFGTTVVVYDEDADKEVTYQIVGPHEADAGQGRLSVDSPIAKALIGRSVGDISDVTTPGGSKSYEVVSIEITR